MAIEFVCNTYNSFAYSLKKRIVITLNHFLWLLILLLTSLILVIIFYIRNIYSSCLAIKLQGIVFNIKFMCQISYKACGLIINVNST